MTTVEPPATPATPAASGLAADLDRLAGELRTAAGRLRAGEPLPPATDDSPLGRRLAELAVAADLLSRSGVTDVQVGTGAGVYLAVYTLDGLRALLDAAGLTDPADLHAWDCGEGAWHVGGPSYHRHNGTAVSIYWIARTEAERDAARAWLAPLGVPTPAEELARIDATLDGSAGGARRRSKGGKR
ncbi:MAG: hypothetical protein IRZ08_12515 [Frankia sp.]|nr:hypothetical protein [Frankia sp.]